MAKQLSDYLERLPDLNSISRHRHYRSLNQGPKGFFNVLVGIAREKKTISFPATMLEISHRLGTVENNRKRLRQYQEILIAFKFIQVVGKIQPSKATHYEIIDEWMAMTDEEYKSIKESFLLKTKAKEEAKDQKKMQNYPEYQKEHQAPWTAKDVLDHINQSRWFKRSVRPGGIY